MVISSHEQLRTFFAEQAEVFIGKPTRCTYGAGLSYRAVRLHGRHWTQGDFLLEPVPRQILRCLKDSADRPALLVKQCRPVTTAVFSTVLRRTSTVRELRRVRNASWWLCENGLWCEPFRGKKSESMPMLLASGVPRCQKRRFQVAQNNTKELRFSSR